MRTRYHVAVVPASAFTPIAIAVAAIAVATLGSTLLGQAPSAWSTLPVPGGVQSGAIQQRGKVLTYRSGPTLHAWSALTRTWRSTSVTGNATVRIANDVALIADGSRITGFASYTGRFASITVGAGAQVVNPTTHRNDSIVLVQDGMNLWAFSGFVGQWVRRTVSSSAQIAVQRHVAVVADGTSLYGMSAFRGRWQSTTLSTAATAVFADGSVGIAQTLGDLYGFSALRETWQSTTALQNAAGFRLHDDLAVWWDNVSYVGFSGLRGTFSRLVTGVAANVDATDQIAVASAGSYVWLYSAPTGSWTVVQLATTPTVVLESSVTLLIESNKVHGFSAPRSQLATYPIRAASHTASATVAAVLDTNGKGALFSALQSSWSTLPTDASGMPSLTSTGALVTTSNGYSAFSARTGSFHGITTSAAAIDHTNLDSAVLAVEDGNRLLVFEPRRRVWLVEQLTGTGGLAVHVWRTSMVAVDGSRALGFGAFHGRIESVGLTGGFGALNSNSESSRVEMSKSIAAFSAVPLLSTPWQFPEFRRTFVAGADLDLHLSAAASTGHAWLALGVQPPFPVPGLGDVMLDAAQLWPIPVGLDARTGTARASIPVPDLAALRGLEVFMQALVLPLAGQPYVTDLASVLVY